MNIEEMLRQLLKMKGSDLHLMVGLPPYARVHGELFPLPGASRITDQKMRETMSGLLTSAQIEHFEKDPDARFELDFARGFQGMGRFRFNVHKQRGTLAASIRALATRIPTMHELGLPPVVREIIKAKKGLVLVTGPTGSGKSTTLASMIDTLNEHHALHIITVEDPIEYHHNSKKSIVTQREVGDVADTLSFHNALKYALRQDPDVILIGEMRDCETIEIALTSAETGHLVLGTLHTSSASQTVSRIIDVFPAEKQPLIMTQLAINIVAVLAQILLPRADGKGRVLASEVMRTTAAIRNGIRTNRIETIYQAIQTSAAEGMCTMDKSMAALVEKGLVRYEDVAPYILDNTTHQNLQQFIKAGGGPRPKPPSASTASPQLSQSPAGNSGNAPAAKREPLGKTVIPPWEQ